jgi:hypothetical protein
MRELLRTSDPVRLSFLLALLADAGIDALVLDAHVSAVEAGLQGFPRRLAVGEPDYARARRVLTEAGELGSDV